MESTNDNFTAEIFDSDKSAWSDIKEEIVSMEQEAFGNESFTEEQLSKDFEDQQSTIAILKETDSGNIIGFTYAKPDDEEPLQKEKEDTVLICDVVIKKEFRKKHLVGRLMECLENELRRKNFKYIETYARLANNYADNVAKSYKNSIIEQNGPLDSKWGPQMFFKIKL